MLRVCKISAQQRVKSLDKPMDLSTMSTKLVRTYIFTPQKNTGLHNFTTQYSTAKNIILTAVSMKYSTVSTEPITTTTII